MSNHPIVSVVVATYGHEKYIREALDSILRQETEFDFEILVGEDNSPDNTRAILKEYEKKHPSVIKLVLRDENIGTTQNVLDLRFRCQGKYVASLEGDDYWTDVTKLQTQLEFLEKNPDYIGVSNTVEGIDEYGNSLGVYPTWIRRDMKVTTEDFLNNRYFSSVATMYRNFFTNRSALKEYSELFTSHRMIGDLTFCLYLLTLGKVHVMNRCMSVYRIRNSELEYNYNSIRNTFEKSRDHIELLNSNNRFYKGKLDFSKLYNTHLTIARNYAITARKKGDFRRLIGTLPLRYRLTYLIHLSKRIVKSAIRR